MMKMAGAVVLVFLTFLVCSHVAFSQDPAPTESPQVGGQPTTEDDPILIPVETIPVVELIDDGPSSDSCPGECQAKCNAMPLECEFIDDNLPVNCENNTDECLNSCDSIICKCVDNCEQACAITGDCEESCLDTCFSEQGYHSSGGEEEVPTTSAPNSA